MKKLFVSILLAFILQLFIPDQVYAKKDKNPVQTTSLKAVEATDVGVLVARVEEIKAMDMSTLTASERKDLRKELRSIKNDLKARGDSDLQATAINNGGVYLSVGAIIIIILLLILLL